MLGPIQLSNKFVIAVSIALPLTLGTAVAVHAADPAGTLNVGILTDVTDFDPWNIRTGNFSVLPQLYDSLFTYTPEREFLPQLATGYEFNEDNSAITVTLREGVTFHSGAEFSADAVAAMLERSKQEDAVISEMDIVTSWTVDGPNQITMNFDAPLRASLVEDMLAYFPIPDPAALEDFDWVAGEAGSGPYRLVERIAGERIVMSAFEGYWDTESPRAETVDFTIFSEASAAGTALETGIVDVLYNAPANAASRLESMGYNLLLGPGPFVVGIHISPWEPPFDNEKVRQAMFHVIPRDAIVATVISGLGSPTATVFTPTSPAYSEAYNEELGYDLDKARALFDESGLSDEEISDFKILVPSNRPYNQGLAEVMQAELAKIGINVEIDLRDTAEAGGLIVAGDFEATSTNLSRTHKDPGAIVSSAALQTTANRVLFDDVYPDYVAAIDRLTAAVEPDEFEAAMEDVRRVLADRAWIIPCCTSPQGITVFGDAASGVNVTYDNMLDIRSVTVNE